MRIICVGDEFNHEVGAIVGSAQIGISRIFRMI